MRKKTKAQRLAERREAYKNMPPDKYAAMRKRENEAARLRRLAETPEERERRLGPARDRARRYAEAETPEQRQKRLAYLKAYKPRYVAKNRDKIREDAKRYYAKNKKRLIAIGKRYRKANPHVASARSKRKRQENVVFAITGRSRCRVRNALAGRGTAKAASTFALIGCSPDSLALWLERQFEPGMTWDNRSEWHIDHIIPCNAFDMTDAMQQEIAFHFSNLRPLWAKKNTVKRDRLPVPQRSFVWSLNDIAKARKRLGLMPAPARLDRSAMT